MSLPNYPLVNAGLLYVNGLVLNSVAAPPAPYVAGAVIQLQPGQARDSTNTNDIYVNQAHTPNVFPPTPYVLNNLPVGAIINGNYVGANGVDVAPIVASSMYAVYAIGSSVSVNTTSEELGGGPSPNPLGPLQGPGTFNPYPGAGLLSLNYPNSPTGINVPYLPVGYDMYRLIGYVVTNSSALIANFWNYDVNDQDRTSYYDLPIAAAASAASTTFTPFILTSTGAAATGYNLVPPSPGKVLLNVTFAAGTTGDTVQFLPYGSARTTGAGVVQAGAGVSSVVVPYQIEAVVVSGVTYYVPAILYHTGPGTDTLALSVAGYIEYL